MTASNDVEKVYIPSVRRKKTSETITAPLTKRQPKSKASAKSTAKKAKR
jgi:hypothetical protein